MTDHGDGVYKSLEVTMHQRSITAYLLAFVLPLSLVASVFSQGGGKAEPRGIQFKRGAISTTVADKIKDDQEAEYVIAAKKGQRLTIKLTSVPYRSAVFDLKAPGDADLGLEYDANYTFNKVLPVTGDYLIIVDRPTSTKGTANYKMVITVR